MADRVLAAPRRPLDKAAFLGVVTGQLPLDEATQQGMIRVEGDRSRVVPRFFASFDRPADAPALTVR